MRKEWVKQNEFVQWPSEESPKQVTDWSVNIAQVRSAPLIGWKGQIETFALWRETNDTRISKKSAHQNSFSHGERRPGFSWTSEFRSISSTKLNSGTHFWSVPPKSSCRVTVFWIGLLKSQSTPSTFQPAPISRPMWVCLDKRISVRFTYCSQFGVSLLISSSVYHITQHNDVKIQMFRKSKRPIHIPACSNFKAKWSSPFRCSAGLNTSRGKFDSDVPLRLLPNSADGRPLLPQRVKNNKAEATFGKQEMMFIQIG